MGGGREERLVQPAPTPGCQTRFDETRRATSFSAASLHGFLLIHGMPHSQPLDSRTREKPRLSIKLTTEATKRPTRLACPYTPGPNQPLAHTHTSVRPCMAGHRSLRTLSPATLTIRPGLWAFPHFRSALSHDTILFFFIRPFDDTEQSSPHDCPTRHGRARGT